jgi:hypothetical protein
MAYDWSGYTVDDDVLDVSGARPISLVKLRDRDLIAFMSEYTNVFSSSGRRIARGSSDEELLWEKTGAGGVSGMSRMLMYQRIGVNGPVTMMKWVPYLSNWDFSGEEPELVGEGEDNWDEKVLLPLIEVYSPSFAYDAVSDTIHMWFWTNVRRSSLEEFSESGDAFFYRPDYIYPMTDVNPSEHVSLAIRGMFYAQGKFGHWHTNKQDGAFPLEYHYGKKFGFQTTAKDWDILPVFRCPKLVRLAHNGVITDLAGSGSVALSELEFYSTLEESEETPGFRDRVQVNAGRIMLADGRVYEFAGETVQLTATAETTYLEISKNAGHLDSIVLTHSAVIPSHTPDFWRFPLQSYELEDSRYELKIIHHLGGTIHVANTLF